MITLFHNYRFFNSTISNLYRLHLIWDIRLFVEEFANIKVTGPRVQTFYVEKDSHMDAILRVNALK